MSEVSDEAWADVTGLILFALLVGFVRFALAREGLWPMKGDVIQNEKVEIVK